MSIVVPDELVVVLNGSVAGTLTRLENGRLHAHGTHEKKLRLAMKVGDEYAVHPQRNTWPRAAQELGIDADRLVSRVRELAAAAPAAFADASAAPEVVALGRATPATLVDLVAERARRCAVLVA